jgi:hypothetical protein
MEYKLLVGLVLLLILTLLTICVFYRNKCVKEEFKVRRDFFSQMEEKYTRLQVELNSLKMMLNERNDVDIVAFKRDVEATINQLQNEKATIHDIASLKNQISEIRNDLQNNVVRYSEESSFNNDDIRTQLPKITM